MASVSINDSNDDLVGVWNWDFQHDRFRSCPKIYRYFGVDPQTAAFGVPIRTIYDGIHPEDRLPVRRSMARALQGQDHIDLHYRAVGVEHGIRPVRSRGHVFRAANNDAIFLCGFILNDVPDVQLGSVHDAMIDQLLVAKSLSEQIEEPETGALIDAVLLFAAQRLAKRTLIDSHAIDQNYD